MIQGDPQLTRREWFTAALASAALTRLPGDVAGGTKTVRREAFHRTVSRLIGELIAHPHDGQMRRRVRSQALSLLPALVEESGKDPDADAHRLIARCCELVLHAGVEGTREETLKEGLYELLPYGREALRRYVKIKDEFNAARMALDLANYERLYQRFAAPDSHWPTAANLIRQARYVAERLRLVPTTRVPDAERRLREMLAITALCWDFRLYRGAWLREPTIEAAELAARAADADLLARFEIHAGLMAYFLETRNKRRAEEHLVRFHDVICDKNFSASLHYGPSMWLPFVRFYEQDPRRAGPFVERLLSGYRASGCHQYYARAVKHAADLVGLSTHTAPSGYVNALLARTQRILLFEDQRT